jgi:hypothetical protein
LESSRQGAHDRAITSNPPKITYGTIWASALDISILKLLSRPVVCAPLEGLEINVYFLSVFYYSSLQYTNYVKDFGLFIELHGEERK